LKATFKLSLLAVSVLAHSLFAVDTPSNCRDVSPQSLTAAPSVDVMLQKASLRKIFSDRLMLDVTLTVTAVRDSSIQQVTIRDLRVNGIPFYADTIREQFSLQAHRPSFLPHPLVITVHYHDLDSIAPLRQALDNGKAHVTGTALVEIRMNPFAKLVLLGTRAETPVFFQEDIVLDFPGGPLAKATGLKVLDAVGGSLGEIGETMDTVIANSSRWRRELWQDYAPGLFQAYSRFTLKDTDGNSATLECSGMGFRIGQSGVVVTKEVLQPWKFNPEIVAETKRRHIKVDPASVDLWIWPQTSAPANGSHGLNSAYRLSARQLSVVEVPPDDMEAVLMRTGKKIGKLSVHRRNSASNLALLQLATVAKSNDAHNLTTERSQDHWDDGAVFRSSGGSPAHPGETDLVFLSATEAGNRISLGSPLDSSAWGSPFIAREAGVVGIVQDENSAIPWQQAVQVLKVKTTLAGN